MAVLAMAVPHSAGAQLFLTQPDFKPGPISPDDPLVGRPIPGATQAEYRAILLWNMRAGLNVAALQCQFAPSLRTVGNYNAILAQHSVEMANAYQVIEGYFKKIGGPVKGPRLFDDYTTITYNNWSTMQAQLGFCQTAASVGRAALAAPKGELFTVAQKRMRELRNSLIPMSDFAAPYNPWAIQINAKLPPLDPQCYDKKDQLKAECVRP
ncbi:MAG: hypothetical protein JWO25_2103 [Alphaproteobacteria bacterium]|nr:hypothetical protein [Alphaproteobacteria bacterium]MDB5722776.1 hypothetical protein [Alphaproteobacteria bacterium]